ncbi:MAG: zinc ribbon domain-containing protein [Oscillospiraceae bacterium]|jgi:rubrerythrin|nr:zinc ribbon domain-containing protein [Oscillospiraceae bacterium]
MADIFKNIKDTAKSVSQKVKDTAEVTAQKVKDTTDTMKFESAIKAEDARITQIFVELGRKYSAKYAESFDPDFQESFAALAQAREKTEQLKHQVSDLKRVVKCANCGADIPSATLFCPTCGAKNEYQSYADANTKKCPSCGANMALDAVFCTSCGQKTGE